MPTKTRCAHYTNEPAALLLLYVPADLVGRPMRFTVAGLAEGYKTQRNEDRVLRRLFGWQDGLVGWAAGLSDEGAG